MSWGEDAPISLDFSGHRPRLRIYAEAEKGHQDRLLPIPPDFYEFLLQTPPQRERARFSNCIRIPRESPYRHRMYQESFPPLARKREWS